MRFFPWLCIALFSTAACKKLSDRNQGSLDKAANAAASECQDWKEVIKCTTPSGSVTECLLGGIGKGNLTSTLGLASAQCIYAGLDGSEYGNELAFKFQSAQDPEYCALSTKDPNCGFNLYISMESSGTFNWANQKASPPDFKFGLEKPVLDSPMDKYDEYEVSSGQLTISPVSPTPGIVQISFNLTITPDPVAKSTQSPFQVQGNATVNISTP